MVVILFIASAIVVFVPGVYLRAFFLVLVLPFLSFAYSGFILKITIDDNFIRIYRPGLTQSIAIGDIAFCAIHDLADGKSLVYCFTRKRWFGRDGVTGIKSKQGFDSIVMMLMDDNGNFETDLDINFHRAKKIPVSFVEDGDQLKNLILKAVDLSHVKKYSRSIAN